jgi:hypothetical protein
MDNKEFSKELEKYTLEFAVRIIRFSTSLPNTPVFTSIEKNAPQKRIVLH